MSEPTFREELRHLINKYSKENDSDTPDFLLADYIDRCLSNWSMTIKRRDAFFSYDPWAKLNKPLEP